MADRQLPLLPKMLISLIVLLCVSWHLPTMAQDETLLLRLTSSPIINL